MEQARGIIVKTLTILAGFWLSDLAAARVQAGIAAGESMKRIIDGMTIMLQHPLALGFDRASLLCGLGGACAVGLFHLYRWSMRRNWRDGEEYGSARWSTSREMAPYTDRDTRQNLQMTATEGLSLDAPATRRNLNTAVIGGSGSGKTATHVIPNILKGSMNYACTDPKGELYAKTGGKLKTMGYTVKQLDLVDLTSETKFNPMRYIDPTKPDVAIMRLVTNIMDNTNGSTPKEHQTDDFWTKSERSLLTALTAFVYYLPDDILKDCLHIDTGQTLNAVADMRDLLEASEQDETKESQVDAVARTATEIYEETRAEWEREDADHDDPDLREAWRLAQGLKFAARQYRPFTQGAGETKKGIIISLGVRLQQSAERIGMRGLGANQPLAWDVDILHTVIHLLHDSLLADHTRNGITILSALLDILGNDSLCHQRAHTIVYQYDIILCTSGIAQAPQTIADGVLIAVTTLEDPLQLGDVKLVGIRLQYHFPSLEAHHADGVYLRMALESLHGIDDNRYVINRHKLLWDILSHTVTNTACSQ